MKINSIQNYKITKNNNYQSNSQKNNVEIRNTYKGKLPSTQTYLAFMGGYSLDLAQTIKQLDKLAEKNSSIYPPYIRDWANMILAEGNKQKETLISIHKKYFENLADCDTLDQIKAIFPEFKNVKSAFDVETAKGKETLISKFQKGESEYFDNDEDLSVQLIKLYWGHGFSLNDLKRYADGTDLYYTMTKLEIPTASRDYGHILKMSDPEYNQRLTAEMTEKRMAALDRKAQERDGEAVYIPRHYSPERGKRISEGLQRFYEEHPERTYEMSERQKQFYRENPERAEIYSKVLTKAWNIFGADNIKKAMTKFFKKQNVEMFDITDNPANLTKKQSDTMKMFWGQNEWAKKSFSKNMKFAWKKVKNENEKDFYIDVQQLPTALQKKLRLLAQRQGISIKDLNFNSRIYINDVEKSNAQQETNVERINELVRLFEVDNPKHADDMANTYLRAVYKFIEQTKPKIDSKNATLNELVLLEYLKVVEKVITSDVDGKNIPRQFSTYEIHDIYNKIAELCINTKQHSYVKDLNKSLDDAYEYVITKFNPMNTSLENSLQKGYELMNELYKLRIALEKS